MNFFGILEKKLWPESFSTACCATCDELWNCGQQDFWLHTSKKLKKRDKCSTVRKTANLISLCKNTQPLPHLQTNKVCYLRQLLFYDLRTRYTAEKQGNMLCWTGGAAQRGM